MSILGEVQDDHILQQKWRCFGRKGNLTKLNDLLKKIFRVVKNTHEIDLIEWFQVDIKDKGYKQKCDDEIVRELSIETSDSENENDGCDEETEK